MATRSLFGFAGSPTWVQGVQVQQAPSVQCKLIDAADPQRAATEVVAELDRLGALSAGRRKRRKISLTMRTSAPGKDVWVVCEGSLEFEITRGSLELLSAGDELAAELGGALVAVGFPAAMRRHARLLAGYGADQVLLLDHPALDARRPESAAACNRVPGQGAQAVGTPAVRQRTGTRLGTAARGADGAGLDRGRDWS